MDRKEFYHILEEITGAEPNSIDDSTMLKGFEGWDSLAIVQFIASVDEHFGLTLPVKQITTSVTVQDLIGLFGDRIN